MRGNDKKTDFQRDHICSQHAVWHVFRGGESDLSRVHGADGGQPYLAGRGRLPHYWCGPAPSGCGRPGHQPGNRTSGAGEPGGKRIRYVLHLCALPDDRAIFCHTQMRQCLLYCGDGRHTCGGGELPFSGSVFLYFLCGGPVFCPQARADHDMDRESAEPSLSCISCRPCGAGTDCAHGWCP